MTIHYIAQCKHYSNLFQHIAHVVKRKISDQHLQLCSWSSHNWVSKG